MARDSVYDWLGSNTGFRPQMSDTQYTSLVRTVRNNWQAYGWSTDDRDYALALLGNLQRGERVVPPVSYSVPRGIKRIKDKFFPSRRREEPRTTPRATPAPTPAPQPQGQQTPATPQRAGGSSSRGTKARSSGSQRTASTRQQRTAPRQSGGTPPPRSGRAAGQPSPAPPANPTTGQWFDINVAPHIRQGNLTATNVQSLLNWSYQAQANNKWDARAAEAMRDRIRESAREQGVPVDAAPAAPAPFAAPSLPPGLTPLSPPLPQTIPGLPQTIPGLPLTALPQPGAPLPMASPPPRLARLPALPDYSQAGPPAALPAGTATGLPTDFPLPDDFYPGAYGTPGSWADRPSPAGAGYGGLGGLRMAPGQLIGGYGNAQAGRAAPAPAEQLIPPIHFDPRRLTDEQFEAMYNPNLAEFLGRDVVPHELRRPMTPADYGTPATNIGGMVGDAFKYGWNADYGRMSSDNLTTMITRRARAEAAHPLSQYAKNFDTGLQRLLRIKPTGTTRGWQGFLEGATSPMQNIEGTLRTTAQEGVMAPLGYIRGPVGMLASYFSTAHLTYADAALQALQEIRPDVNVMDDAAVREALRDPTVREYVTKRALAQAKTAAAVSTILSAIPGGGGKLAKLSRAGKLGRAGAAINRGMDAADKTPRRRAAGKAVKPVYTVGSAVGSAAASQVAGRRAVGEEPVLDTRALGGAMLGGAMDEGAGAITGAAVKRLHKAPRSTPALNMTPDEYRQLIREVNAIYGLRLLKPVNGDTVRLLNNKQGLTGKVVKVLGDFVTVKVTDQHGRTRKYRLPIKNVYVINRVGVTHRSATPDAAGKAEPGWPAPRESAPNGSLLSTFQRFMRRLDLYPTAPIQGDTVAEH